MLFQKIFINAVTMAKKVLSTLLTFTCNQIAFLNAKEINEKIIKHWYIIIHKILSTFFQLARFKGVSNTYFFFGCIPYGRTFNGGRLGDSSPMGGGGILIPPIPGGGGGGGGPIPGKGGGGGGPDPGMGGGGGGPIPGMGGGGRIPEPGRGGGGGGGMPDEGGKGGGGGGIEPPLKDIPDGNWGSLP